MTIPNEAEYTASKNAQISTVFPGPQGSGFSGRKEAEVW